MIWVKKSPIKLELDKIEKEERRLSARAEEYKGSKWKETVEEKIPDTVSAGLQKAFCKAFELIFQKGSTVIEKTFKKTELEKDFQIRDFAVDVKGKRRDLKNLFAAAGKSNFLNMAVSAAEGLGLGFLGIGMPDVVLFTSTILKGTYEMAIHYGFSYDTPRERLFLLKLLKAAVSRGERWTFYNEQVEKILTAPPEPEGGQIEAEIKETAEAFAMDLLVLKFIQGIPVAGMVGGLANPVYYNRIVHYVQLKYRKRYLLGKVITVQPEH